MRARSSPRRRRPQLAPALLALPLGYCGAADAVGQTTASWVAPVTGDWTDAARWSTSPLYPNNGTPPGATYRVVLDAGGGPHAVRLAGAIVAVASLSLRSPDATLHAGAGSLAVGTFTQSAGTTHFDGADVSVNGFGTITGGRVLLSAGTLRTRPLDQYVLHGAGVTFEQTGGTHELTITRSYEGLSAGAGGSYRMSGGTFDVAYPLTGHEGQSFIGHTGAGTFHQSGGVSRMGRNTPMFVGSAGDFPNVAGHGSLVIEGGGTQHLGPFTLGTNDWRDTVIGIGSVGFGTAIVRDGALADLGYLQVGTNRGTGTLVVSSGATVRAAAVNVGWGQWSIGDFSNFHGTGVATLSGAGSRLDAGAGTFNIGTFAGGTLGTASGRLVVAGGTMTVAAAAGTLTGDHALLSVRASGRLDLDGGAIESARGVLVSGGRFNVSGGAGSIASAAVQGNGTMTYAGGRLTIGTLSVGPGRVSVAAGSGAVPHVTALNLTAAGNIDLSDSAMIVDYAGASPLPAVRGFVVAGYDGGGWTGQGITSSAAAADESHGVGYAEASAVFASFPATFGGFAVDDTSVLLRYTRYGDANLDGTVNLADFNRLAAGFGSTGAAWDDGDFNYDGVVNLADFNLLATNFGVSATGAVVTPQDWAALASAVPEPARGAGAGAGAVLACNFAARRRRRG